MWSPRRPPVSTSLLAAPTTPGTSTTKTMKTSWPWPSPPLSWRSWTLHPLRWRRYFRHLASLVSQRLTVRGSLRCSSRIQWVTLARKRLHTHSRRGRQSASVSTATWFAPAVTPSSTRLQVGRSNQWALLSRPVLISVVFGCFRHPIIKLNLHFRWTDHVICLHVNTAKKDLMLAFLLALIFASANFSKILRVLLLMEVFPITANNCHRNVSNLL